MEKSEALGWLVPALAVIVCLLISLLVARFFVEKRSNDVLRGTAKGVLTGMACYTVFALVSPY